MTEQPTTNLENSVATPVNVEEPTLKLEDSTDTPAKAEEPTLKLEDSTDTPAKAEEPTQKLVYSKFFKIVSIKNWYLVILRKLEDSTDTPAKAEEPTTKLEDSATTLAKAEEPTTKLEDSTDTPANAEDPTLELEYSLVTPAKAEKPTQKSGFGKFFKFFKIVSIIIWSLVILIVIFPLLGRAIINQALGAELTPSYSIEIAQPTVAVGEEIGLKKALNMAYKNTEKHAINQLEIWEEDLIKRIDTDFLDWYFNYFNQKKQEFGVLFKYVGENFMNGFNQQIVNEKIANDINESIKREFAKRVLQANAAEMKFDTIVIDTTQFYFQELSTAVENVPKMYKISQPDWDKYLEAIKVRLENEQGDGVSVINFIGALVTYEGVKFTAEFAAANVGAQAAKLAAASVGPQAAEFAAAYVGVKIASKFAANVGSKIVAVVSAKLASAIEPAAAIALIVYDYWDYTNGVKENRPRLREDLVNCLHDIKKSLLSDPENGIMAGINELQEKIKSSISQSNLPS